MPCLHDTRPSGLQSLAAERRASSGSTSEDPPERKKLRRISVSDTIVDCLPAGAHADHEHGNELHCGHNLEDDCSCSSLQLTCQEDDGLRNTEILPADGTPLQHIQHGDTLHCGHGLEDDCSCSSMQLTCQEDDELLNTEIMHTDCVLTKPTKHDTTLHCGHDLEDDCSCSSMQLTCQESDELKDADDIFCLPVGCTPQLSFFSVDEEWHGLGPTATAAPLNNWVDRIPIGASHLKMTIHDACRLCPRKVQIVRELLLQDPADVLRPMNCPMCGYNYPLHIAICRNASLDVLKLLVEAGPSILVQEDGPSRHTPLSLALAMFPQRVELHTFLLASDKRSVRLSSSKTQSLPLHVACQHGAPTETLVMLILEYPDSSTMKNIRGQTPRDIIGTRMDLSARDKQEILQIFSTFCGLGCIFTKATAH